MLPSRYTDSHWPPRELQWKAASKAVRQEREVGRRDSVRGSSCVGVQVCGFGWEGEGEGGSVEEEKDLKEDQRERVQSDDFEEAIGSGTEEEEGFGGAG